MKALLAGILLPLLANLAGAEPPYRTDGGDEKLPWFELKPGEFPPEGSAHYIAGELVGLDHINRTGVLRVERTDAIRRSEWDLPMPFILLPYGALQYHGAPAELRDLPIGTHLHGYFFCKVIPGKGVKAAFTNAALLEDDLSFATRQQRAWQIAAVDLEKGTLSVRATDAQADSKPIAFQIAPATRVWKARAYSSLAALAAGQTVWLDLTVCSLKGPGRCTDIWLDQESRAAASASQLEVHRQFQREHGLASMVGAVDNQQGIVTAILFAGFDPKLMEDFVEHESVTAAVAEDSLRTYDQNSDRMRGELLEIQKVPPTGIGDSGLRLRFKPTTLLEGFRPKRIVRIFSGKWKVDDLPKEERLYPPGN